ncbi:hypothetical protein SRB17_07030 [Streptomyces sp. RB17]|nr:hypothetical protein [Streptomyces sp. RB17]
MPKAHVEHALQLRLDLGARSAARSDGIALGRELVQVDPLIVVETQFPGYWSRRIDDTHRLVYKPADDELIIVRARYHY